MIAQDTDSSVASGGLLAHDYGEPLDDDAFLALGNKLGRPMLEDHPSVQPFVGQGVILNLISEYASTDDPNLQPFATNFLTLHTESSARPLTQQPRFIVLMCVDPGDDGSDAQTVVVSMEAVAARLGSDDLMLLSRTRYRQSEPGATIVRRDGARTVFTFRDFGQDELHWAYDGDDATEDDVNAAISGLLAAMYQPDSIAGVRWQRGKLVAIDNTYFFHGRSAGLGARPNRRRHLKRLRIIAKAPDGNG